MSAAAVVTSPAPPSSDTVNVTVDGRTVAVPRLLPDWRGKLVPTTMIQACEQAGVEVPHYCYHAKLPVAGNCRMCLVEYGLPALGPEGQPLRKPDGSLAVKKSPRPAIACATPISPGMEIYTATPEVQQMRASVLEFLLINHPLDCPICDQAGECKLQEYSVEYGHAASRFVETKVHKPKQVDLGPRIMLDDERCILCTRCIRFTRDLAGDDALGIVNRGSYNTLAAYPGRAFDNPYTLNTVDLCPVGALTAKDFRFQMRVWFLKETKSLCTSCGTGCNVLIGSRENRILRYTPRANDAVNVCWLCDHGRLNYRWIGRPDRLRQLAGSRLPAPTWDAALTEVAQRLRHAVPGSVAVVASARLANEELYLIRRLAQHTGAATDIVPRSGPGDAWLIHADKNPNSLGAQRLGISADPAGSRLSQFAAAIGQGTLRTLLVFGEDVTPRGLGPELLDRLECLVVSDILPNRTTERAHVLLPGCAHAEKCGSFTNVHGRVQRFFKAVEPPGGARPEVEFLRELLQRVSGEPQPDTAEGLFHRMAAEVPAFAGLTWAGLGDTGAARPPEAERVRPRADATAG
ncbi:MAG: 2Fe-2S iron-sulfur cluster binding domain-containing protein [Verrucomicrobia bacterium]|nr:2Fe-2S iron-sulfur cluster binding domain-containing protein [Verrucomicrobiota bacterium]